MTIFQYHCGAFFQKNNVHHKHASCGYERLGRCVSSETVTEVNKSYINFSDMWKSRERLAPFLRKSLSSWIVHFIQEHVNMPLNLLFFHNSSSIRISVYVSEPWEEVSQCPTLCLPSTHHGQDVGSGN